MFSKPNPFEELVNTATDENLTSENWDAILLVCDKVSKSPPDSARDCIAAVQKRLGHRNANVQLYALALTDALVKNCDVTVHREISSRTFTNTLSKLIHEKSTHEQVRKRSLELIQTCSFEFRADSSLGLMNDVYHSLRAEGIHFPNPQKPKKEFTQSELDKQKEEEEFQLALALSLSETENRSSYRASSFTTTAVPKTTTSNTDNNTTANTSTVSANAPEEAKVSRVRALYDFQPTEQGELGFQKGDIIRVIESVYRDWWKGELRGKTGIFPVNYVEKIVDPTPADLMKEAEMESEVMGEIRNVDRLLDILANIDPRKDAFSENDELQTLYNGSLAIRPKLVRLIEKYSLKKDELVALNEKFLQARTMYDHMLNDSIARYSTPGIVPTGAYGTPSYDHRQVQQNQQQSYGYPNQPYQLQQQTPPAPTPQPQQAFGYQQQGTISSPQQQPVQQPSYGGFPPESSVPQLSPQQQPATYDTNTQSPGYANYSTQPSYTATTNTGQGYPPASENYNNPAHLQQQAQPVQPGGYAGTSTQDQLYNTTQPIYNQGTPQQTHQTMYPPHAGAPPAGQTYNIPQQSYAQNY
ncbi:hypothetical protein BC941DRAFT_433831 [Chlamydoabsidia padenii]|nr:hypothetical protein BC941DRAFT_433831 [Chlamydoabsidia padenii]